MDVIIRDFSSGSKASTVLCARDQELYYKKTASGEAADKLRIQYDWLQRYRGRLPVAKIAIREETEDSFSYYMPAEAGWFNFFEFIHKSGLDDSWALMEKLLESLEKELYSGSNDSLSRSQAELYISEKLCENLKLIEGCEALKPLISRDRLIINGREYPGFEELKAYFSPQRLAQVFEGDSCSPIHGDLTVENIICNDAGDFYLIDPNPIAAASCPSMDYAKLLQSFHGDYEFLKRNLRVRIEGERIGYKLSISTQYPLLHQRYRQWLYRKFKDEGLRRIYFHEIIHWLRLMPYRMDHSEEDAVNYFIRLVMLMEDVKRDFE